MQTKISEILYTSFRIDTTFVDNLVNLLTLDVGPVEITAECTDHAERTFETISELVAFDNISNQKIIDLKFIAHSLSKNRIYVSLNFHSNSDVIPLRNKSYAHIYINGSNEKAVYLHNALKSKIETTKPWFSKYSSIEKYHVIFALYFPIFFGAHIYTRILIDSQIEISNGERIMSSFASNNFISWLGATILSIVICIILYGYIELISMQIMKIRKKFFPDGTFLIGFQKTVEENLDSTRRQFLTWTWRTLLVAIVGGLGKLVFLLFPI